MNSSSLDSIRNDISNIRWADVLSHAYVNTSYEVFYLFSLLLQADSLKLEFKFLIDYHGTHKD